MSVGYFWYLIFVFLVFAWWIFGFAVMRGQGDRRQSNDLTGFLLTGPMHFYLKHRGYRLSKREIFGWSVVFLFMALAPLLRNMLS